jgi:hypothetical protein
MVVNVIAFDGGVQIKAADRGDKWLEPTAYKGAFMQADRRRARTASKMRGDQGRRQRGLGENAGTVENKSM